MNATRDADITFRNRTLWRASLGALAGAAVSMAIGGLVTLQLSPGLARLALSTLATAAGLMATGIITWRNTRPLAGDLRRPGLVAVLAFLAVHDREWLRQLSLTDPVSMGTAEFVLTFVAFGFAMLVFKWLVPIDAREASQHRREQRGAA